jgi:hypothetical protein
MTTPPDWRHRTALVLLAVAALCAGVALASIYGDDLALNEPGLLAGALFAWLCAAIVERLR